MALTKNDVERVITCLEKWIVEEKRHQEFLCNNTPQLADTPFVMDAINSSRWYLAHFKQRLEEYKAYLNHLNVVDGSGMPISA